jgi:plasmid stabilization system protein ParE
MALADREAILEYIAQDNGTAAIELDEEFEAKAEVARQRPTLYRAGRVKGTRESWCGRTT